MLRKSKYILSFCLVSMAITTGSLPVYAQFQRRTDQSKQTIQSLHDGDYFYGGSPSPDRIGVGYVIFRKTGDRIVGWQYYNKKDSNLCFRGTATINSVTNVTKADFIKVANRWVLSPGKPLDLGRLYKMSLDQTDNENKKGFQECTQIFSNKK